MERGVYTCTVNWENMITLHYMSLLPVSIYLNKLSTTPVTSNVTNAEISTHTGLTPVMDFNSACQYSPLFGDIARLTQRTPAHNALYCQVGQASGWSGRLLGGDWRRRPGRPRARWTDQLRNDTGSVPANLWSLETGHSSYGAMVDRRDGPSWLRDDDDDNDDASNHFYIM